MLEKDPSASIKKYLRNQNRPYSVNDLVLNLHKEFGKTAIQKALDLLVVESEVLEKINGKQRVYAINQEHMPTANEAELSRLDQELAQNQDTLKQINTQLRSKETSLKNIESSITTSDALARIEVLKESVSQMEERLEELSNNRVFVTKEEKEKVMREHENSVKEWKKRKRMLLNITDSILESYPKSKKALFEEIEIETDEDAGVQIPDI